MNKISQFLQSRIDAGDFPSAIYLVAENGEIVFQDALGYAVIEPERIEARIDTIYDVASLTKPLVTGLLAIKLIELKELWLNDEVAGFVEPFAVDDKRSILIENLAIHTSGLPAWIPLNELATVPDRVLEVISELPLAYETDSKVLYSDLNFIILQAVIERIANADLADFAAAAIFEPLGLSDTGFKPAMEKRSRIAASESGRAYEQQMSAHRSVAQKNLDETTPGTNSVIWGEVHDGNAWFMGGVAGHAGLFSTAEEVFIIAKQFLPKHTELLKPEICDLFTEDFEPELNEHRSFAFQLAKTPGSTAGSRMSPQSFGHTGFTGTSLWIDPVTERIFVLLTNRTHAHPLPFVNINSVRRRFHDLAIDLLEKNL